MVYWYCMSRISFARVVVSLALVSSVLRPIEVFAAMSSTNYQIPWDSFVSGGLDSGGSENYQASDSIGGGFSAYEASGDAYVAQAGYRSGDERPLSFEVAMAPVGGTSARYSAVSISALTVTLSDVSDAGSFAVGDRIALVESPGLSQLVVVGKIASISGGVITVDRFDGDTATITASPPAGSASIMILSGGSISFGSIDADTPSVATGLVSVTSDVRSGYTVYVVADGEPRTSGGDDVDPVADGAVTAGAEEYGIEVVGTRAASAEDIGFSTAQVAIQSSTNVSSVPADRVGLSYKVSISSSQTPSGTYAQVVSFTLTPNY